MFLFSIHTFTEIPLVPYIIDGFITHALQNKNMNTYFPHIVGGFLPLHFKKNMNEKYNH